MKHKVLLQALCVEGADWRVVAHLLRYEPETQILSAETQGKKNKLNQTTQHHIATQSKAKQNKRINNGWSKGLL